MTPALSAAAASLLRALPLATREDLRKAVLDPSAADVSTLRLLNGFTHPLNYEVMEYFRLGGSAHIDGSSLEASPLPAASTGTQPVSSGTPTGISTVPAATPSPQQRRFYKDVDGRPVAVRGARAASTAIGNGSTAFGSFSFASSKPVPQDSTMYGTTPSTSTSASLQSASGTQLPQPQGFNSSHRNVVADSGTSSTSDNWLGKLGTQAAIHIKNGVIPIDQDELDSKGRPKLKFTLSSCNEYLAVDRHDRYQGAPQAPFGRVFRTKIPNHNEKCLRFEVMEEGVKIWYKSGVTFFCLNHAFCELATRYPPLEEFYIVCFNDNSGVLEKVDGLQKFLMGIKRLYIYGTIPLSTLQMALMAPLVSLGYYPRQPVLMQFDSFCSWLPSSLRELRVDASKMVSSSFTDVQGSLGSRLRQKKCTMKSLEIIGCQLPRTSGQLAAFFAALEPLMDITSDLAMLLDTPATKEFRTFVKEAGFTFGTNNVTAKELGGFRVYVKRFKNKRCLVGLRKA